MLFTTRFKVITITGLALVFIASRLMSNAQWVRHFQLSLDGGSTSGTVTQAVSSPTEAVHYTFTVGSKQYEGEEPGSGPWDIRFGEFRALHPGDSVPVSFLLANPNVSGLGGPSNRMLEESIGIVALTLFGMTFLLTGVLKRNPNKPETEPIQAKDSPGSSSSSSPPAAPINFQPPPPPSQKPAGRKPLELPNGVKITFDDPPDQNP